MQSDTSVLKLDINKIVPNKYQPRKVFDEKDLNTLAESIKQYGIINPILVRKKDEKYEIIAGERRFRAAKLIGLTEVPVIIKNADEQEMAELALIENIQRQGLSPIEEAKSYEEIMRIGNQTQSSLATKIGKSQASIANKIRLLSLPQEIQDALANKKISERHARSLITVDNKERQLELLERIMKEKLTVKETEQIINEHEINEEEIKQAISDIMKSLNIKEEEKEDDNMNNGNFFPNFDNNSMANNNASLNMMNMQSMNQQPVQPEPEMVMPTTNNQINMQPQMSNVEIPVMAPTPEIQNMNQFDQFGPMPTQSKEVNINNSFNPMDNFMNQPQNNFNNQVMPTIEPPMMNDAPLFGGPLPPADNQFQPVQPEPPVMAPQMEDIPLFNPSIVMPSSAQPTNEFQPINEFVQEVPTQPQNSFEIPVTVNEPTAPVEIDRLTELQNLLTNNGYNYKVYSNDTDNCVIIELPRN